jgi:hypothetical protein
MKVELRRLEEKQKSLEPRIVDPDWLMADGRKRA